MVTQLGISDKRVELKVFNESKVLFLYNLVRDTVINFLTCFLIIKEKQLIDHMLMMMKVYNRNLSRYITIYTMDLTEWAPMNSGSKPIFFVNDCHCSTERVFDVFSYYVFNATVNIDSAECCVLMYSWIWKYYFYYFRPEYDWEKDVIP